MKTQDIRDQVVEVVATAIHISPCDIDLQATFDAQGFDSLSKVGIVPTLEQLFGCTLGPEVLFDHPTVQMLSEHILNVLSGLANCDRS
jgi:acyl carrier protein